jgi:hypothetical protein
MTDCRFKYRGIRTNLDRKHFDLAVKEETIIPEIKEEEQENWKTEPF